ncbi:MAG: hypothetical protein NTV87_12625 [Ignavibacteriae bacterium]|nr:hypothetical protein [Ignavibacteriota bacterium]
MLRSEAKPSGTRTAFQQYHETGTIFAKTNERVKRRRAIDEAAQFFCFRALPESLFFLKLRRLPGADRQAINRFEVKAVLMFFQFCFCFETKTNLNRRLHIVTALLVLVVRA